MITIILVLVLSFLNFLIKKNSKPIFIIITYLLALVFSTIIIYFSYGMLFIACALTEIVYIVYTLKALDKKLNKYVKVILEFLSYLALLIMFIKFSINITPLHTKIYGGNSDYSPYLILAIITTILIIFTIYKIIKNKYSKFYIMYLIILFLFMCIPFGYSFVLEDKAQIVENDLLMYKEIKEKYLTSGITLNDYYLENKDYIDELRNKKLTVNGLTAEVFVQKLYEFNDVTKSEILDTYNAIGYENDILEEIENLLDVVIMIEYVDTSSDTYDLKKLENVYKIILRFQELNEILGNNIIYDFEYTHSPDVGIKFYYNGNWHIFKKTNYYHYYYYSSDAEYWRHDTIAYFLEVLPPKNNVAVLLNNIYVNEIVRKTNITDSIIDHKAYLIMYRLDELGIFDGYTIENFLSEDFIHLNISSEIISYDINATDPINEYLKSIDINADGRIEKSKVISNVTMDVEIKLDLFVFDGHK